MLLKISAFFVLIFCDILLVCYGNEDEGTTIKLENEYCMPRETLVSVGAPLYLYTPMIVSVFRCGGTVKNVNPTLKQCVKNSSEILQLEVESNFLEDKRYSLENHTSCIGQCVFDGSQCSKTQSWDPENCKCLCNSSARDQCPEHHIWNQNLCQCECSRTCIKRQIFNETDCSCTCKPKFYKRCNRREKLLVEDNCTCVSPKAQIGQIECNIIPTKWAILIIVLSFVAFFILAFDCVLYGRGTGCIFHTTHMCLRKKDNEETTPMNHTKHHVNDYTETTA